MSARISRDLGRHVKPYLYIALNHIPPGAEDFHFPKDWQQFKVALSDIGIDKKVSAERLIEVFYSRLCLKLVLKKKGIHLMWRDLGLDASFRLYQLSQLPISLSHTKEMSIAIMANDDQLSSIGIDLEKKTREISETVAKFMHNQDDLEDLPDISRWCLKEAAYKCFSHAKVPIKTKELVINKKDIKHQKSGLTCQWEQIELGDYVVAICYI